MAPSRFRPGLSQFGERAVNPRFRDSAILTPVSEKLTNLMWIAGAVVVCAAILFMTRRFPPKPFATTPGYPPGVHCTSYGRQAARVCEKEPSPVKAR
jgi:hypothetical protein